MYWGGGPTVPCSGCYPGFWEKLGFSTGSTLRGLFFLDKLSFSTGTTLRGLFVLEKLGFSTRSTLRGLFSKSVILPIHLPSNSSDEPSN